MTERDETTQDETISAEAASDEAARTEAGREAAGRGVRERLLEHARRLQAPFVANLVYRDFLDDEERARLGPLQAAYDTDGGGTVGMWARAKGIGRDRAVVDLARLFGLPDGEYRSLLRAIGAADRPVAAPPTRPVWNRDRGELLLDGEVIRRILSPGVAVNLVRVLDAFQEEGWPDRIDDPLPPKPSADGAEAEPSEDPRVASRRRRVAAGERLKAAVMRLNQGLTRIVFGRDGSGEGIRWDPAPPDSR